ncbi:SiaB family protein kinase [bacterium]|nr:SiaB family protein kinase [bacterium]
MLTNLYQINQSFDCQGIFLNLSGPLSQNLMVEMGGLMKTKMKLEGSDSATIRKAFSVLVELNHNIIHYSAEKDDENNENKINCQYGCGIISVGKEGNHYFLLSGNLIDNHRVKKLRTHLLMLSKMSKEELKTEYHNQRKSNPDKDSKGAGLGLIEMSRNACRPLEFKFDRIDDKHTFFTLKTVI